MIELYNPQVYTHTVIVYPPAYSPGPQAQGPDPGITLHVTWNLVNTYFTLSLGPRNEAANGNREIFRRGFGRLMIF